MGEIGGRPVWQEAILDLLSEADAISFDGKNAVEVNTLPNGGLKVKATEEEAETDDGDLVDPYSTFHFDPTNKTKTASKESGQVVVKEATGNSETSMPDDDILAGYDNKAFENDEKSASKVPDGADQRHHADVEDNEPFPSVTIQHGGGETSTDALIHQIGEKSDPGNGGSVGSGDDVTPAVKEASDETPEVEDANNVSPKGANSDSQKHDDGSGRQNGILDESLPVTHL
ncbi:hypothetical protein HOLleu_38018 [Holothuria leucospilota]|uniref:Uncharacterized protein n=1 Tax=Holothuria leucospilota TaxID=206669 RepID=A0A9Q1BEY0_HOLLE|nr:hypothetical protein HOLleu_38018 [Holothuria leucospilota]